MKFTGFAFVCPQFMLIGPAVPLKVAMATTTGHLATMPVSLSHSQCSPQAERERERQREGERWREGEGRREVERETEGRREMEGGRKRWREGKRQREKKKRGRWREAPCKGGKPLRPVFRNVTYVDGSAEDKRVRARTPLVRARTSLVCTPNVQIL